MRQALHIFRKDAFYLRGEVALVAALAVLFARESADQWTEILLVLAAAFLISRVVHAEPIPGDSQFWITRPYERKSLLASKVLFIAAFVSFPILAAQLYILGRAHFSILHNFAGLLLSDVVLFFTWLSIAALAAVTASTSQFSSSVFAILGSFVLLRYLTLVHGNDSEWPGPFEWTRTWICVAAIAGIAVAVLYAQYLKRATVLSRTLAVSAAAMVVAIYALLPPAWAMNADSRHGEATPLQVSMAPRAKHFSATEGIGGNLTLRVSGVPDGDDLRIEAVTIDLAAPGGRAMHTSVVGGNLVSAAQEAQVFDIPFAMPAAFYEAERGQTVAVRGTLYFTFFGNARTRTVPLGSQPVDLVDGIRCGIAAFGRFACERAFGWPARILSVDTNGAVGTLGAPFSYAPFPAALDLADGIERRWTTEISPLATEAVVTVKEPVLHVRRDFDLGAMPLAAIATPPSQGPLSAPAAAP
jgi:hypothetical protein